MFLMISMMAEMEILNPTPLTTVLKETVTQSTGDEEQLCEIASVRIVGELSSVISEGSKLLLLWDDGCKFPNHMKMSMEDALVQNGFSIVQRGDILFGKEERKATMETQDTILIHTSFDEGNGKWFQHLSDYAVALPSADYILIIKPLEYKYKEKKGYPEKMWFKAEFSLINAKSYVKTWGGYIGYERISVEPKQPEVVKVQVPEKNESKPQKTSSKNSSGCGIPDTAVAIILVGSMVVGGILLFALQ